jgi:hypothetical protein
MNMTTSASCSIDPPSEAGEDGFAITRDSTARELGKGNERRFYSRARLFSERACSDLLTRFSGAYHRA